MVDFHYFLYMHTCIFVNWDYGYAKFYILLFLINIS